MKVSCISSRPCAIHFLFLFVFSFVISISHSAVLPGPAGPPLSTETANPINYALQTEESDSDFNKDDEFAKLHAFWASRQYSAAGWCLQTSPTHFFKRLEKHSLLPRSPPL